MELGFFIAILGILLAVVGFVLSLHRDITNLSNELTAFRVDNERQHSKLSDRLTRIETHLNIQPPEEDLPTTG